MKYTVRTRTNILIAGIIVSGAVLMVGLMNQAGFVLSGPYVVRGGTLTITDALPGSTVFIDEKRIGTIGADGSASFARIHPGKRTTIVSHASMWPWTLTFESQSGQPNTLTPLQVRRETQGSSLTDTNDPLYISAKRELDTYREPTRINPLERNGVMVWVDGSTVYAQENGAVRTIFASIHPITSVMWYGDRNDAIIVATQNVVAALDLRGNKVQNYLPLYTGVAPRAAADSVRSTHIFVEDDGKYFTVDL